MWEAATGLLYKMRGLIIYMSSLLFVGEYNHTHGEFLSTFINDRYIGNKRINFKCIALVIYDGWNNS